MNRNPAAARLLATELRISKYRCDLATNRFWLARIYILLWAIDIPIMAFGAPESMLGQALHRAGVPGFIFMLALTVVACAGIADSIVNGDRFPWRWGWSLWLMRQRHIGFMVLASQLVISGAGLLQRLQPSPAVMTFFLFPAAMCVAVTALDLRERHMERNL